MANEEIKQGIKNEILMEFARKLGTLIRDSAEMKRLNAAEKAYKECGDLQAKVTEYYVNQKASEDTHDEELGVLIRRRMDELLAEIEAFPVYEEYMQAQYAVRDLMNAVNDEVQYAVSGERSCSPDKCASCRGCSGAEQA